MDGTVPAGPSMEADAGPKNHGRDCWLGLDNPVDVEQHMRENVQHDGLTQVSNDIWIFDAAPIQAAGFPIPLRMTVVRLSGGDLLLHSPVKYSPALRAQLERLGTIKYLLGPNIAHWMFLRSWQTALPELVTFAVPGLASRNQVRRSDVRIDRELGDGTPDEWASDIETVLVKAPLFCEAALFDKRSRTLILTDIVQNIDPSMFPGAS